MPKKEFSAEHGVASYEYPQDGLIRRRLHEYGSCGRDFYGEVLRRMGYGPEDIAIDIGAGVGRDGLSIASFYRPRAVYLLEPPKEGLVDFDSIYYPLELIIQEDSSHAGVELLPCADYPRTIEQLADPQSPLSVRGVTYIQPVPGVAEDIPLPAESVSKLSMIHSAYHFQDLPRALSEVERVLAPGGIGVLVTNGPDDKTKFRELLQRAAPLVGSAAPTTVSSRLDYVKALDELSRNFEIVGEPFIYKDVMEITPARLADYRYSYDSYKHLFSPVVINDGRWSWARETAFEDPIRTEMAASNGVFHDSIDIGAIYFRKK